MPKIDNIEYKRRIFTVQGWIIEGVQSALIVRQIIAQGWTDAKKEKDQQRSAERLLQKARDQWTAIQEEKIDQKRSLRVAEYKQLARTLKEKYQGTPSGLVALMSVHKQIDVLEGLKPAKKLEVSGPLGKPIETKTTIKSNVDYSKLPTEVLEAIVNARSKPVE